MEPFDPLTLEHIGVTLAVELLEQPLRDFPPTTFTGAGIYALYYFGSHPAYRELVAMKGRGAGMPPIYVGSSVGENAKHGFSTVPSKTSKLATRLNDHAKSIESLDASEPHGLTLDDFKCRYLILNDPYIVLAESVMITTFRPLWNGMGFGSKVVGANRTSGKPSLWDSLHPGRGGRPLGTAERMAEAKAKIHKKVASLAVPPTDAKTARMVARIMRSVTAEAAADASTRRF